MMSNSGNAKDKQFAYTNMLRQSIGDHCSFFSYLKFSNKKNLHYLWNSCKEFALESSSHYLRKFFSRFIPTSRKVEETRDITAAAKSTGFFNRKLDFRLRLVKSAAIHLADDIYYNIFYRQPFLRAKEKLSTPATRRTENVPRTPSRTNSWTKARFL